MVGSSDKKISSTTTATLVISISSTIALSAAIYYTNRIRRSKWMSEEDAKHGNETTHSVIDHFKSLVLDPETTVKEANKRRTTTYYLKMRESHNKSLVLGVSSHSKLVKLRKLEIERTLKYWKKGNQSHRTILVMCDESTRSILANARRMILQPLNFQTNETTKGCWIPPLNIIPMEDMHVTVALPWWWHTIQAGNDQLTKSMAQRFKQTLLLKFHYPFQIELERIILLGGKVLVALWRCVGNRTTEDGRVIYDRHGENLDPMHRLREEIIRCFTTESPDERRQPLTYQHRKMNSGDKNTTLALVESAQHTIKQRTPGMGSQCSADGFIHTTLCRLPLECLSSHDVELDAIHRLCREASATLCGHRMVVEKYRFLETMGEGGESNPCYRPIYDEIIEAPLRHSVGIDGSVEEKRIHSTPHQVDGNLTYGRASLATDRNFISESAGDDDEETENTMKKTATLSDLFEPPKDIDKTAKTDDTSK